MRPSRFAHSVSLAVLTFFAATVFLAQAPGQPVGSVRGAEPPPLAGALSGRPLAAPAGPVQKDLYRLWKDLAGTYESRSRTETVKLVLRPISMYRLFLEATDTHDREKHLERGTVELTIDAGTYNRRLTVAYRPESLGQDYSCTLTGEVTPGGFSAETGASDCSFPLRRSVAKWKIEATSRGISVTETESGQVTRLVRLR